MQLKKFYTHHTHTREIFYFIVHTLIHTHLMYRMVIKTWNIVFLLL